MDSELALPNSGIHQLIKTSASGFESLPYVKILNGNCEEISDDTLTCRVGDLILKPDNVVLGKKVRVVIGPWRIKAMTVENNKVTRVDYNITGNSKYIPEQNDWDFPDGITPTVKEISESPSKGVEILNAVGYDILFYFLDHHLSGCLWVKGTALTMSKIFPMAKRSIGKVAYLTTKEAQSKSFKWWLPHIEVPVEQPTDYKVDISFKKTIEDFLNPGVYSVEESEKPR